MKKAIRSLAASLAVILTVIFSISGAASYLAPSALSMSYGESGQLDFGFPLSLQFTEGNVISAAAETDASSPAHQQARLMLFDSIPVKSIDVTLEQRKTVIPGGQPFGIRLYTDGLIVSDVSPVQTKEGSKDPAGEADIEQGDIILSVNGEPLTSNEQLLCAVCDSGGKPMLIRAKRNNRIYTVTVTPVRDAIQNEYKLGLYVRDSCAGIGTMTLIDPETGYFAGLGHGICDTESGRLMPLLSGDIVPAEITAIRKSTDGAPGSLLGSFSDHSAIGSLGKNSHNGVYGTITQLPDNEERIPVAFKQEVLTGSALLRTTIDDTGPHDYTVKIKEISYNNLNAERNMVVQITDSSLLQQTGGIVQGMSGSPIFQNGRLVGALTHVFVNDPTCGYAVFAENMIP